MPTPGLERRVKAGTEEPPSGWLGRWRDFQRRRFGGSVNRKIFWAAGVTASFSLVAKVFAIAKESLVARQFGRAPALDAFFIALLLPTLAINLVGGTFGAAFIPTFVEARAQGSAQAAEKLLASVATASALILLLAVAVLCVAAPLYLPWIAGSFTATQLVLTRHLIYSLAPYIYASGLALIWTAVLNAEECFGPPAILAALPPATLIVLLLVGVNRLGIFVMSAGMGIGASLQAALLWAAVRRRYYGLRLRWHGSSAYLQRMGSQSIPVLAAALLMGSTDFVDQAMAALLPSGSVSGLVYGNRVIAALMAIGATSISTAVLPYFSQMVERHDWEGCQKTLYTYLRLIGLVTVPTTLLLIAFSHPLVKLLYQRGAFHAADTLTVTHIQQALALQLPFYIAMMLLVRLIFALQANRIFLWGALVALPVDVLFDYIFMQFWGIVGIALATAVMYTTMCALVLYCALNLLRRRENETRGILE